MGSIDESTLSRYRDYRSYIDRTELPRATRNGAWIVAVLTTAFIALDWFVFREVFIRMLWVRVVCDLVMLAIATVAANRYPKTSCICGVLCAGWMLLEVSWVAGGGAGQYTPGLMLLFLGMPVLLPLTAMEAAGIVVVLVIGLGLLTIAAPAGESGHAALLQLAFPLAAGAESV